MQVWLWGVRERSCKLELRALQRSMRLLALVKVCSLCEATYCQPNDEKHYALLSNSHGTEQTVPRVLMR